MTFFNTIILLGSIQGTISFILLWRMKKQSLSNKFLSVLIALIALACLNIFLLELNIEVEQIFWRFLLIFLPLTIIMPLGPLMYFYVLSLTNPSLKLLRKDYIHFYPAVLDFFPSLVYLISYLLIFLGLIEKNEILSIGSFVDSYDKYVDIPRWISISFYLVLTFKVIANQPQNHLVKWGKQMAWGFLGFQAFWLIFLILYLFPATSDWLLSTFGWYPLYVPLTAMVYWFGIKGFLISVQKKIDFNKPIVIEGNEIARSIQVLNDAMLIEKLYLNPTLNLSDVVNYTGLSQKTISAVLNQHLGKSFNEFVNEFRIEEVKRKIADVKSRNLTLSGIAFECGFNSQATFQRTFKTATNQTPGQFAKSIKNLTS